MDTGGLPFEHRSLLGRKTGIVGRLFAHLRERDDPAVHAARPEMNAIERITPGDEAEISLSAGGKGRTRNAALASAVGEAVERYCAYSPEYERLIDESLLVYDSHEGLCEHGYPVVDFDYLDFYTESQHADLRDVTPLVEPPMRGTELWWRKGYDLVTGEPAYVPAQLVYMERNERDPIYFLGTSNGLACGTTLRSALSNSLSECVERDAIMRTWYRQEVPPVVDATAMDAVASVRERLGHPNVAYTPFVCETDVSMHVIGCGALDERDERQRFVLGGAASLDPTAAVAEALIEAAQGVLYVAGLTAKYEGESIAIDEVADFEQNVAHYSRPEHLDEVAFLLDGDPTPLPDEREREGTHVEQCIEACAAADVTPIGFDVTTRDVREAGLHVTRVVVPELLGLPLPAFPPTNHPRFPDLDGTPKPHPFP